MSRPLMAQACLQRQGAIKRYTSASRIDIKTGVKPWLDTALSKAARGTHDWTWGMLSQQELH